MCLRPVAIRIDRKSAPFKYYADNLIGRYDPARSDMFTVPCGKCEECVRDRQNHHAYGLYKRIEKCSCVYHLTLTYKPSALPFSCATNYIDRETGETYRVSPASLVTDEFLLRFLRGSYSHFQKSSKPLYCYSTSSEDLGNYEYVYTPSLNRYHVRSMIKCCRIQFERDNGFKVPEFSYSFCGEYGPRRCRPHYHMVLASKFDISEVVRYFDNYWRSHYGFTVVKKVEKVTEYDNKKVDGYLSVARYISKYISKGDFECLSCVDGYSEKGRVCQSKHLDAISDDELDRLKEYHLAYDVFGKYSPITMRFESSGRKMSRTELNTVVDEIIRRQYVLLGNCPVSIPRNLKQRLFCKQIKHEINGKTYKRYLRYTVSYLVLYRLSSLQAEREDKFLQQLINGRSSQDLFKSERSSSEIRAFRINEKYKAFLQRSLSNQ